MDITLRELRYLADTSEEAREAYISRWADLLDYKNIYRKIKGQIAIASVTNGADFTKWNGLQAHFERWDPAHH